MASITKRGKKFLVRWRDPDGVQRGRSAPDREAARALAREVDTSHALGRRWRPPEADALPSLLELDAAGGVTGGVFADFLEVQHGKSDGTIRHYNRALKRFLLFLAARNPTRRRFTIDLLTKDAAEAWFGTLIDPAGDAPIGIASARLLVGGLYCAWDWAWDSDTYGAVIPRPRRFRMPVPSTTPAAAPSWEQMDAVIAQAYHQALDAEVDDVREKWLWRARLLTLLRFLGLRVDEQIMRLRWDDFDLDSGELTIRGELGKSARERQGRRIPIAPALVEEMAGWGVREGYVVAPHKRSRMSTSPPIVELWQAAKVGGKPIPPKFYAAEGGRDRGQCHHAFRKGFKTGLAGLGVAGDVRDFLVGHHRGIDERYLDTYAQARTAVKLIPPLSDEAQAGVVLAFPSRLRT